MTKRQYKIKRLKENGLDNIILNDDFTNINLDVIAPPLVQFIQIGDKLWLKDAQSGSMASVEEIEALISFLQYSVENTTTAGLIKKLVDEYEDLDKQDRKKHIENIEDTRVLETNQLREELKHQGYVYLIKGEFGRYKIGASKNPIARLKQLRLSSAENHKLVATMREENMYFTESDIHDIFKDYRVHSEWFELDENALEYFLQIAEAQDVSYETMKAEYGDCLNLERIEIKGDI